jgi:hypothetical protein
VPVVYAHPCTKKHNENDNDDNDDSGDDNDDSGDTTNRGPVITPPLVTPTPTPEPSPTTEPSPEEPLEPTQPTTEPAGDVGGLDASLLIPLLLIAAIFAALGRNGGLARHAALVADRDDSSDERHVVARDAEAIGDRSFTWRFPGHGIIDAASVVIPARLARFSPLLGRITEDGSEFRAIFGLLSVVMPILGLILGVAAALSAGAGGLPPALGLLIAGAVLASFDALAGTIAAIAFAVVSLASRGATDSPDWIHSLLVLIAVAFLWMAIPLIGSAIRPLRRDGDNSLRHNWDRTGDVVIAALLCGWVAQKLTGGMDLFAEQPTGLPDHANLVALTVMAAIAARIVVEHMALVLYPRRLSTVESVDSHPEPPLWSKFGGAFARSAVFAFIGFAFIGAAWQWWLASILFFISQVLGYLRPQVPNIPFVHRILPRGIVEILVLVASCTLLFRYGLTHAPNEEQGLKLAFLLMVIPPTILSVAALFTDDEKAKTTWRGELLGVSVLVVTIVLALQGWDY